MGVLNSFPMNTLYCEACDITYNASYERCEECGLPLRQFEPKQVTFFSSTLRNAVHGGEFMPALPVLQPISESVAQFSKEFLEQIGVKP